MREDGKRGEERGDGRWEYTYRIIPVEQGVFERQEIMGGQESGPRLMEVRVGA